MPESVMVWVSVLAMCSRPYPGSAARGRVIEECVRLTGIGALHKKRT